MKVHLVVCLVLLHVVSATESVTKIRSPCLSELPVHPFNGTGCGTPQTVDLETFGDNARSSGVLRAVQKHDELRITVKLKDLPRPDLVLTSWILWVIPGPNNDKVFDVTLLAWVVNQINSKYTSSSTAKLHVKLDFNPSYPDEGPSTGKRFCFQKDIPGIEDTPYRQPPVSDGAFTPVANHFLRKYDSSGFEKLDRKRKPRLVRSPVGAIAFIVAVHVDQTTHGVTAGNFPLDNYELLSFIIDKPFGKPIFKH